MRSVRSSVRRSVARAVIGGSIVAVPLAVLAAPAEAHPLGNATVSHYDGLTIAPGHVDNFAVEDSAEIPTVGRSAGIDTDGNGTLSREERTSYAAVQCASLAQGVRLSVGATSVPWTVLSSSYMQRGGAAGLPIGRLECRLRATADVSAVSSVSIDDSWDGAGIGWHEITAVGEGMTLTDSPVPAESLSNALLVYPNDMLSSPLDVRAATIQVTRGPGTSTYVARRAPAPANWLARTVGGLTTRLDNLVQGDLDVGVGVLAVLLSVVLGAGHAMLPGHGKTIMAAYLVGKRGRLRDVVTVGATVTITHTVGVLVLGTLISLSATFAPTAVEQWLGVVSGAIVVAVGGGLLVSALRRRRAVVVPLAPSVATVTAVSAGARELALVSAGPGHDHHHDHPHDHDDHHTHPHPPAGREPEHSHALLGGAHSHGPGTHTHDPADGFSRKGLIGLGAAGGLVPSPSALLVLLATVALGRTAFGVVLVLAYGVGMAGALTIAGLLLVRLRNRLATFGAGRYRRLARLAAMLPVATATLVIAVGIGLAVRSLGGSV
ncbi:MAG: Cobalt-zinc-cadmium resistance protein CzcD [Frankiales bacterium]|nr:Cobalt-zinc-cadmium resistance protein CzcD [Frankiales bacterium]